MASFISGEISANDFSEKNAAKTLFGEVTVPSDASDYDEDGLADIIDCCEKLMATKDYVTPIGIRTFTIQLLYVLPIILSPYYVAVVCILCAHIICMFMSYYVIE